MNMKRMRGRNHRPGSGGGSGGGGSPIRHHNGQIPLNRNHVFDSNGPDLRIRGTAQQLFEKYLQLGRDATSSGDRVMAEGYFQHAEHYFRILNAIAQATQQSQGVQHGGYPNNNQQRGRVGDEQDGDDRGTEDPLITGSTPQPQIIERQAGDRQGDERQGRERQGGERQSFERQGGERQNFERQGGERQSFERHQNVERQAADGQGAESFPERQGIQPQAVRSEPAPHQGVPGEAVESHPVERPAVERVVPEKPVGEPRRERAPRQPRERAPAAAPVAAVPVAAAPVPAAQVASDAAQPESELSGADT